MNFDNPVYRKTTEDTFQIEKNNLHVVTGGLHPSTMGEEVSAWNIYSQTLGTNYHSLQAQQPLNPSSNS